MRIDLARHKDHYPIIIYNGLIIISIQKLPKRSKLNLIWTNNNLISIARILLTRRRKVWKKTISQNEVWYLKFKFSPSIYSEQRRRYKRTQMRLRYAYQWDKKKRWMVDWEGIVIVAGDENCEEIRSEESTGQRRREIGRCTNRGGSSAKERNLLKNNAVLFATAIGVRRTLGYERCRVDL